MGLMTIGLLVTNPCDYSAKILPTMLVSDDFTQIVRLLLAAVSINGLTQLHAQYSLKKCQLGAAYFKI